MDTFKYVTIKNDDGTINERVPIGADAINIDTQKGMNVEEVLNLLNEKDYDILKEIRVERNRINLIIESPNSNENTELVDIRIGADGKIYDSAGEAVREQIKQKTIWKHF